MHPLVRDLYKRAIIVGRDYPHPEGIDYVRKTWKAALRNPNNCRSCYRSDTSTSTCTASYDYQNNPKCEKEIRLAVGRGRQMVKEMIGIVQLKKYRTLRRRYGEAGNDVSAEEKRLNQAIQELVIQKKE